MIKESSVLLKCTKCKWVFIHEHSSQCPYCGSPKTSSDGVTPYNLETQTDWIKRQKQSAIDSIMSQAKKEICCYASRHTNGWRHDTDCKNHTICY